MSTMTTNRPLATPSHRMCNHRRPLPVYRSEHIELPPPPGGHRPRPTEPVAPASLQINIVLAVVLAISIVAILVGLGGGAAATSPTPALGEASAVDQIEVYVVQPGDTLWSIAADLTPPGADVRPVVDYLSDAAGGSLLDVGQRIAIDRAAISD